MLGLLHHASGFELKRIAHNSSFALAAFAALVLVLAQLGAMNHAYSHVPRVTASVQDLNPAAHAICDECLSFAPVLSSAGSPAIVDFVAPPPRAVALRAVTASLIAYRLDLAFRSRAPPVSA
jgi:hypothetical protein